ncbi:hypothetical protein JRI60_28340 [Archangium violaceum]|uniref:hypothetical protein n=1 Tax=Archangium violaceum TaxID=83451 RepID=UPI0019518977|nr:hypothetical protein [Archangium violaceum]QRN93114.1 hypothetical protein JRI60_28340 [Archangium violaceum]
MSRTFEPRKRKAEPEELQELLKRRAEAAQREVASTPETGTMGPTSALPLFLGGQPRESTVPLFLGGQPRESTVPLFLRGSVPTPTAPAPLPFEELTPAEELAPEEESEPESDEALASGTEGPSSSDSAGPTSSEVEAQPAPTPEALPPQAATGANLAAPEAPTGESLEPGLEAPGTEGLAPEGAPSDATAGVESEATEAEAVTDEGAGTELTMAQDSPPPEPDQALAQFRTQVSRRVEAIPNPHVGGGPGVARVQREGEQSVDRVHVVRARVPASAQQQVPRLPTDVPAIPAATPEEPVPHATFLIEQASNRLLSNQTLPALQSSPRGNTPRLGQRPLSAERLEQVRGALDAGPPVSDPRDEARMQLLSIREGLLQRQEVEPQAGPPITLQQPVPPQPQPLAGQARTQAIEVFASLMADVPTTARDMLRDVRLALMGGEPPRGQESLGEAEMLPELEQSLGAQLGTIATEAGVAGQQLDEAVLLRREQLAAQTQQASSDVNQCVADQTQALSSAGQELSSTVATERQRLDAQADAVQASLAGGTPEDLVRVKRDRLLSNVNRTAARQTARYRQARETREAELAPRELEYTSAYEAVTQRDVFQLREAPPADQTPEQLQALIQTSENWGRERRDEVVRTFGDFRTAIQRESQSFTEGLDQAAEQAREEIRDWAATQTGETRGFFTRLFESWTDWSDQARANAQAWEELRNQETAALVGEQLDLLTRLQDAEAHGISEQQVLEANRLTREQEAVVRAFFHRDRSRPVDPIAIVAAAVRARLVASRRGELEQRLRALVLERCSVDQLETIGNQRGPLNPSRVRERGNAINRALHGGIFGMNETEAAMEQLGGLNEFQALALRKYYKDTFGDELDDDLRSELHEGEFDRAQALLSGRQEEALAAQLFSATQEQFLGTSLGTDEAAIFRALRGLTREQRDAVERIYRERYHQDLRTDVLEDLGDWTTSTTHDAERATALFELNVARADAIALDQALYFGGSSRRQDAEAVYQQISQDVQQQAQREGWTTARMQEEMSRRTREVTREYDARYANEPVLVPQPDGSYQQIPRGSLQQSIERTTFGGERDLLVALSEANQSAADAARIRIERESLFQSSDTQINQTIESQYTRALEDTRRDLEAERRALQDPSAASRDRAHAVSPEVAALARRREDLQRDLRARAASARPPWDENTYFREQQLVEQRIEGEITELARRRASGYMTAMTAGYQQRYGETVEQVVRENVQNQILGFGGDRRDEALTRLRQGGYLDAYQQFDFAERAGEGDRILQSLQNLPPDELQRVRERWEANHRGRSFDEAALSAASGEHSVDVQVALRGRPQTLDELVAQEALRVEMQRDSGVLTGWVAGPERATMEHRLQQLRDQRERLRDPRLREDPDRMLAAIGETRVHAEVVQQAARDHREAVASVTESIANAASIAVAVVVGAVGAIFTGGASAAVALAIIASLASTATSMGTRALFMGRAYGREQMYTDMAVGVVDAVVAALTAGMGNRLLGIRQVATSVAERQVAQQAQRQILARMRDFTVRQMSRLGNVGRLTQSVHAIEFLERMAAQEASWYSRLAAHAISQTVENVVQAVPSAVVGSALESRNWEGGNPLLNILGSSTEQVLHGAVMGLAMSGAHASAGHVWGFIRGPGLGVDTHPMPPERLTGEQRQAHLREYLEMHPGRTEADFDATVAREHARALADYEQARTYRESVQGEVSDSLRAGGHPDVSDVPVTVLGPVEFQRLRASGDVTMSPDGHAAIVVRDGQAHVVMRAGADPASVRELVSHLAERVEPGTHGRTKNPAEALPRDLRNRVPIEVNPKLTGETVQVHYIEHDGLIVGTWMEIGPNARAIDITMHADTARAMRRLEGASGRVLRLKDRLGTWFGLHGERAGPGTTAFEARLEVEKLPRIIQERAAALQRAGGIDTPEGRHIAIEMAMLQDQLAHFEQVVRSMEIEPGRGYVAAEKPIPAHYPSEEGQNWYWRRTGDEWLPVQRPGAPRPGENQKWTLVEVEVEGQRRYEVQARESQRPTLADRQNAAAQRDSTNPTERKSFQPLEDVINAGIPEAAGTPRLFSEGEAGQLRDWVAVMRRMGLSKEGVQRVLGDLTPGYTENAYGNFVRRLRREMLQFVRQQDNPMAVLREFVVHERDATDNITRRRLVPDNATAGTLFREYREALMGLGTDPATGEPRSSMIPGLQAIKESAVFPDGRQADGVVHISEDQRGGPPGSPGWKYLIEDKAGSSYDSEQAAAYSARVENGTISTKSGTYHGLIYVFENERAARSARDNMKTNNISGSIFIAYFDSRGDFRWLARK